MSSPSEYAMYVVRSSELSGEGHDPDAFKARIARITGLIQAHGRSIDAVISVPETNFRTAVAIAGTLPISIRHHDAEASIFPITPAEALAISGKNTILFVNDHKTTEDFLRAGGKHGWDPGEDSLRRFFAESDIDCIRLISDRPWTGLAGNHRPRIAGGLHKIIPKGGRRRLDQPAS